MSHTTYPTASSQISVAPTTVVPATFNLTGPLLCTGTLENGRHSLYVENHAASGEYVNAKNKIELRLSGDCAYVWTVGETVGTKTCGLTSYLNLLDSFPLLGQLAGNALLPKGIDPQRVLNSCSKKKINADFSIPSTIQFQEKALQSRP